MVRNVIVTPMTDAQTMSELPKKGVSILAPRSSTEITAAPSMNARRREVEAAIRVPGSVRAVSLPCFFLDIRGFRSLCELTLLGARNPRGPPALSSREQPPREGFPPWRTRLRRVQAKEWNKRRR